MKRRYNITLTPEMDERLNRFAYLTRKSRSVLIEEALEQYLSGSGEDLRSSDDDDISFLKERLESLEAKVHRIEREKESPSAPVRSGREYPDTTQSGAQSTTTLISDLRESDSSTCTPAENKESSVIALDPEGWYTQSLVSEFLDQSVLPSTRKSIVSLAVARGEMVTNGKKRKGCRIHGSSAIRWIASMRKKEKPPVFFLGSP